MDQRGDEAEAKYGDSIGGSGDVPFDDAPFAEGVHQVAPSQCQNDSDGGDAVSPEFDVRRRLAPALVQIEAFARMKGLETVATHLTAALDALDAEMTQPQGEA